MKYLGELVTAAVLVGCTGHGVRRRPVWTAGSVEACVSTAPPGTLPPRGALPAAEGPVGPIVIDAPPVEAWPRAHPSAGPYYVVVSGSPYVGQYGVVADSDRADDGRGFGATVGWRTPRGASRTSGYEALIESSDHRNAHSDVRGSAVRVGFGRTWGFRPDEKLQPFVLAGACYHTLLFEKLSPKFDIAGPGGYLGGGVDLVAAKRFTARLDLRLHVWFAADGRGRGGVAETATCALGVATGF